MFVDRGVGSPNFARPTKETFSMSNFKLDSESKVVHYSLQVTRFSKTYYSWAYSKYNLYIYAISLAI